MEYYKLKIKSLSYELRKLQETNTNNESEILSLTLKLENVLENPIHIFMILKREKKKKFKKK